MSCSHVIPNQNFPQGPKDCCEERPSHLATLLSLVTEEMRNKTRVKHKILLDDYKVRPELNKHKNI